MNGLQLLEVILSGQNVEGKYLLKLCALIS